MDVGTSEGGAFWLSFLRSLSARGLEGVVLVISDAHRGLRDAIATVFAGASWSAAADQQPSAEEVHVQMERVVDQLSDRFPGASSMLAEDGVDVLAFTGFPGAHWKQVWSNNPQ